MGFANMVINDEVRVIVKTLADFQYVPGSYHNTLFKILGEALLNNDIMKECNHISSKIMVSSIDNVGYKWHETADIKHNFFSTKRPKQTDLNAWATNLYGVVDELSKCSSIKQCYITNVTIDSVTIYQREHTSDIVSEDDTDFDSDEKFINKLISPIEKLCDNLSELKKTIDEAKEYVASKMIRGKNKMNIFKNKSEIEIMTTVDAFADLLYTEGSYGNKLFRIIGKACVIPKEIYIGVNECVDITVKGVSNGTSYTDNAKITTRFGKPIDPTAWTGLQVWSDGICYAVLKLDRDKADKISDVYINDKLVYHEDIKEVNVDNMDEQIRKITKRLDSVEHTIAKLNEALNSFEERLKALDSFEERLIESVDRTLENNENASKNGYTTSIAPGIVRRIVK